MRHMQVCLYMTVVKYMALVLHMALVFELGSIFMWEQHSPVIFASSLSRALAPLHQLLVLFTSILLPVFPFILSCILSFIPYKTHSLPPVVTPSIPPDRVRPLSQKDQTSIVSFPLEGLLAISPPDRRPQEFEFDHVFPPEASQEAVYDEVSSLVRSCADGYNVCIFAYGQVRVKGGTLTGI